VSTHDSFMRRAFDLAVSAAVKGNHPFGAILVYKNEAILIAENTVNTSWDQTRHAELNLIAEARRTIPPEILKECTLYASTAPCPMCGYAIWESGITRIVYGVTYKTFAKLLTKRGSYISVEEIYRLLKTPAEITGGVLEEEGTRAYRHWPKSRVNLA
jgi:tRNA(Arg) A34 adenosine deaminase TadA